MSKNHSPKDEDSSMSEDIEEKITKFVQENPDFYNKGVSLSPDALTGAEPLLQWIRENPDIGPQVEAQIKKRLEGGKKRAYRPTPPQVGGADKVNRGKGISC